MKEGIHPDYHPVVFQDASNGYAFLTRSTIKSEKTIKWEDGNEYPLVSLEISSSSHPFYTGTQRMVDTAGRVERFQQRYARQMRNKERLGQVGRAVAVRRWQGTPFSPGSSAGKSPLTSCIRTIW